MLTGPDAIAQTAGAKVPAIYLEGRIPITEATNKELGLLPNQVVRAVVEQRPEGLIILINGRPLELPAQLRFRPGDAIWLRVLGGTQGLFLKVSPPPFSQQPVSHSGSVGQLSPVVASLFTQPANLSGLMTLLSPSGGLSIIASLLSGLTGNAGPLASLLKARPSMANISPDAVRFAFRASGLFSEARLASKEPISFDVKLALRELLVQLQQQRSVQTGLLQATESALREMESAQADSLAAASHRELSFSFLIPFRDADPVRISLFRPPRTPVEPEPPYTINMHTRSDSLGELWMKTVIGAGQQLDFVMWADRKDVAQKAELAKGELIEDLSGAGLAMKSFSIFHGRRPNEAPGGASEKPPGLVFDRTA
jgi:hypothetical protein